MWMTGKDFFFFFVFIFLEEREPRALPAAMVLYVRVRVGGWGEEVALVDELDKLLQDHSRIQTVVVIHFCSSTQPPGAMSQCLCKWGTQGAAAAAPAVQLVQRDTDLFTVSLPF